jgi:hypothetical protein
MPAAVVRPAPIPSGMCACMCTTSTTHPAARIPHPPVNDVLQLRRAGFTMMVVDGDAAPRPSLPVPLRMPGACRRRRGGGGGGGGGGSRHHSRVVGSPGLAFKAQACSAGVCMCLCLHPPVPNMQHCSVDSELHNTTQHAF